MNAREMVRRNDEIVSARAQGLGWDVISNTYSIDKRQAERIVAEFRGTQPSLPELKPVEVIEDLLMQFQGASEQLALLAMTAKQDSVKLGAIKARVAVLDQIFGLQRATGIMPQNLAGIGAEIDVQKFAETVLRVFNEHEIPRIPSRRFSQRSGLSCVTRRSRLGTDSPRS